MNYIVFLENASSFMRAVSGIVLLSTAALKVYYVFSLWGHPQNDPIILLLPLWIVLLSASAIEVGVTYLLCFSRNRVIALASLAWLACVFTLYHELSFKLDLKQSCGCMGAFLASSGLLYGKLVSSMLALLHITAWGGLAFEVLNAKWSALHIFLCSTRQRQGATTLVLTLSIIGVFPQYVFAQPEKSGPSPALSIALTCESVEYGITPKMLSVPVRTSSYPAVVTFDTNGWQIKTRWSQNTEDTYWYDGTNVYTTYRIVKDVTMDEAFTNRYGKDFPINLSSKTQANTLYITPGSCPLGEIGVNLPWLAFCSSEYLDLENRTIPIPGADIRHSPGAFGCQDVTTRFSDALRLPSSTTLITSSGHLSKSFKDPRILRAVRSSLGIRNMRDPNKAVKDGVLIASYLVCTTTNFAEFVLPSTFIYEEFLPLLDKIGGTARPVLGLKVYGHVTSIKPSAGTCGPYWPTNDSIYVTDFRFRHPTRTFDALRYTITNGVIPEVSDKRLNEMAASQAAAQGIDPLLAAQYGT
jgi:hypothetical protein